MSRLFTITGDKHYEIVFETEKETIDLLFTDEKKIIRAKHIYKQAHEQLITYGDKACSEVLNYYKLYGD